MLLGVSPSPSSGDMCVKQEPAAGCNLKPGSGQHRCGGVPAAGVTCRQTLCRRLRRISVRVHSVVNHFCTHAALQLAVWQVHGAGAHPCRGGAQPCRPLRVVKWHDSALEPLHPTFLAVLQSLAGSNEGNIALMRDLAEENDKLAAENARLTRK